MRLQAAIRGDCIQTLHPTKLFPFYLIPSANLTKAVCPVLPFTLTQLVYFLFSFLLSLYPLSFHPPFGRFSQKLQASLICRVSLSHPAGPWESFRLFYCISFHLSIHSPLDRLPVSLFHLLPFPSSIFPVSTQH